MSCLEEASNRTGEDPFIIIIIMMLLVNSHDIA